MDKELKDTIEIESLSAEELWKKIYGKELNTKKTILEYIEITKLLKKENVSSEKIQETYNYIYNSIQGISSEVKPNTIMYLQNQLKAQLGKLVKDKNPKKENSFIKYFKEAYPDKERRKDFTWVLMDINSITEEQIWNTLVYINRECLKNNIIISDAEKKDSIEIIEKLIAKNNIKYINQVKSLDKLLNALNIMIVSEKDSYKLQKMKK